MGDFDLSKRDFMKSLAAVGIYVAMPIKAMGSVLPEYKPQFNAHNVSGFSDKATHSLTVRINGPGSDGEIKEALKHMQEMIKRWPSGGKLIYFTTSFNYERETGICLQRVI